MIGNREYTLVKRVKMNCNPRGESCRGAVLFIPYVHDLPLTILSSNVRQYADDTTVSGVKVDKRDLEQCLENDLRQ